MNLRFTIESLESAVGASILCSAASAALDVPFFCLSDSLLLFRMATQIHETTTTTPSCHAEQDLIKFHLEVHPWQCQGAMEGRSLNAICLQNLLMS